MPYFLAQRDGDHVELTGTDARHLARSLRARPGERIMVVEPAGRLLTVRLETVARDRVRGRVEAEVEHRPEPEVRVTLAVAMLPAAALELVLSRCTEAGAAAFLLVEAERSVARGSKPERWAAICREAAMLAGRLVVPPVTGPEPLARAWAEAEQPWLLDRGGVPARRLDGGGTLFVGPEGGWTPAERALAGDRVLGLGPRTLRADTAALVGLALALGAG
ncbi:MAG TPA: RsmE family RNA methyltransferase [Candidatus Eisenbacteria bacterium]|nr:RsmE family RNA methyltransferase [Candidatus Eisenbacteria bacterium]